MFPSFPNVAFFVDVRVKRFRQTLDRAFFLRTRFENCDLEYPQSPVFFFDKSNIVVHSRLHVSKSVRDDALPLQYFKANFPGLQIVRE